MVMNRVAFAEIVHFQMNTKVIHSTRIFSTMIMNEKGEVPFMGSMSGAACKQTGLGED